MSILSDRTLTAMFDTREAAEEAVQRLEQIGVPSGSITITGGPAHEEKGFWEKLFFPEDDREAYAEGIRRGGYLLTVTGLDADLYDRAAVVLEEHEGTVDLDERTEAWRQAGWKMRGLLPRMSCRQMTDWAPPIVLLARRLFR